MVGGKLKESICPSCLMMQSLFPEVFVCVSLFFFFFFFLNQKFLHFHNYHSGACACLREGAHLSPKIDTSHKETSMSGCVHQILNYLLHWISLNRY